MSLTEILAEIPKLSFAERQELVRRAIEVEDEGKDSRLKKKQFSMSASKIFVAIRIQGFPRNS